MNNQLFSDYVGITRYAGVPTEQTTGRLHYNENLYGASPQCMETLNSLTLEDISLYESNEKDELLEALSAETKIPVENLFLNNGSAENIKSILSVFTKRGDTILLPDPGWSYYTGIANYKFLNIVLYKIKEGSTKCYHDVSQIKELAYVHQPKVIFITTPAMPTGNKISDEDLLDIIHSFPDTLILVDEAYLGFSEYTLDPVKIIETYDNVVFSRTFSKYYGLANLRIGYGFASTALKNILWLDMPLHRLPHVNKRMAIAALQDKEYYLAITEELLKTRDQFSARLNNIENVKVYESDANFVYVRLIGYDVEKIKKITDGAGYLIRIFTSNNEKYLRITIGTKEIMDAFTDVLVEAILASKL